MTIDSKVRRIFYFTLLDRLMLLGHWHGVPSRRRINCLDLLNLAFRLFSTGFIRPWTWQLRGRCINLMRRRLEIHFHSILQASIPFECISVLLTLVSNYFILLGATLALSTRASNNKNLLRIYDTRRGLPKATHLMELEPFPFRDDFEGEVNNASFSPDNMYLALARNDNRTHVYDRRMWDRGIIFEYGHGGESKAASQKDVYGVVKAQWVQSQATRRMALVTGGEDGKVFSALVCFTDRRLQP